MKIRMHYIVNKKFQYSFIVKNLIFLIFCFFLILVSLKIWENYQTKQGFLFKLPSTESIIKWAEANKISQDSAEFAYQFIKEAEVFTIFNILAKPLMIALGLIIVLLILFNIYYSHKIAGPLYRLKKDIDRKLKGENITPIKFRDNDEFHELADSVNKLIFGADFDKDKFDKEAKDKSLDDKKDKQN